MKIYARRTERAGDIAAKYKRWQYSFKQQAWTSTTHQEIYDRIVALGDNPLSDDVDAILGHKDFTWDRCVECNEYRDCIVSIGEEPDYESATAYVCRGCLVKAIELIDSGAADHANHLAT